MKPRILAVKNFQTYQHYKHRNPVWIKLHLNLLDDPGFLSLPDAAKWHYIGLLLLASRHENAIPAEQNYIKNRLSLTEELDLSRPFLKSHVLAPRYQHASKMRTNADSETEKSRDREETETETETDVDVDEFQQFWESYPRKEGKARALKSWNALNGSRPADLLAILDRHKQTEQWTKDNGKFIPHPATWLNGKRWEDEMATSAPQQKCAYSNSPCEAYAIAGSRYCAEHKALIAQQVERLKAPVVELVSGIGRRMP